MLKPNENKNIIRARKVMHENNIGCIIVVTIVGYETPVGIITERDVVLQCSLDAVNVKIAKLV